MFDETRRKLLRLSLFAPLATVGASGLFGCSRSSDGDSAIPPIDFGPLLGPDSNGLRLPTGFSSRIIARSGVEAAIGSGYPWHDSPDGGATFATADGGWIYVSNSEVDGGGGGVGAVRFDAAGFIIAAYPILQNTTRNCAGGTTPWGTWLSCEETIGGHVWECDPSGGLGPRELPALGTFIHEAAVVDPVTGNIYLTEDVPDGGFYKFIPDGLDLSGRPNLTSGVLQVAEVIGGEEGTVDWHDVPDPDGVMSATRYQVAASTAFNGGEGAWYDSDRIYFSTKGDDRIWMLDLAQRVISILYDASDYADPVLQGVDNVTISPRGDILVAEDGGDLQIVAITPTGMITPIVQHVGHENSEITGPAFDPSGTRLYFSSQDGVLGTGSGGITFEVSGRWPW